MWRKRASQFVQYVGKVFGLYDFLEQYKDFREKPQIPSGIGLWILLLGIWGRVGSLHKLELMGKDGELDEAVPFPRKPSADTLGRVLNSADAEALWRYNHFKHAETRFFPATGRLTV